MYSFVLACYATVMNIIIIMWDVDEYYNVFKVGVGHKQHIASWTSNLQISVTQASLWYTLVVCVCVGVYTHRLAGML